MGRRRKTRLDLPQRVYFNHGAYFYAPVVGPRIHLGREFGSAMAKWAEIVGRPSRMSSIGEVMDRYMLEVAPKKSPRTYQDNIKEIAKLRAVFGHMQPHDLTAPDVYAYMDARGAPVRANREKALLSHVFSYAIRWGIVKVNPCRDVKRNPEKPRERYTEDTEIEAFKSAASEFISCYVDLKYMTSMRKGDLLRLRLDSLTDEGIALTTGKTGKRMVYLWNPDLKTLVERIKGMRRPLRSLYLFCTRKGQPYSISGFDSIWQRTMRRALKTGVLKERFTEHDIRAKTLTDADERGQDAQRLAGHKSRAMTDRYIKTRRIEKVKPLARSI